MNHECGNSSGDNHVPERRFPWEKRFVTYALAAAGVAASAKPAAADIVFTKVHKTIFSGSLAIDLNQDGIADFTLVNRSVPYSSSTYLEKLGVHGGSGAAVIGRQQGNQLSAWDAPQSWSVGPNSPRGFVSVGHHSARMLSAGGRCCINPMGPWKNVTNRYLGLRFTINGEVHYGWARLSVSDIGGTIETTLTGFAYETSPNTTILAGDRGPSESASDNVVPGRTPPSLGMLSLGSAGLNIWRREDS